MSETLHVIGAEALGQMKPGAILINTGCDGLVEPVALVDALSSGQLAGACLDVFEAEPLVGGDAILSLPNVVVTPHIA